MTNSGLTNFAQKKQSKISNKIENLSVLSDGKKFFNLKVIKQYLYQPIAINE
jgi:hypothetical protein